jgi:hypothetical protein
VILPRGRVPPGQWHFPVSPGVELKAVTEEKLYAAIHEYRVRNNVPIGDIERDVNDFYCTTYPSACVKESHEYGNQRRDFPHSESMLNRVSRWASGLLRGAPAGGYFLVSPEEAASRARVCMNCPKNVPWRGGCAGCSKSTITVLYQIRKTNRTPYDGALQACSVLGWENCTSVWLREGTIPITDQQRLAVPTNCWRRGLP